MVINPDTQYWDEHVSKEGSALSGRVFQAWNEDELLGMGDKPSYAHI